MSGDNSPIQLQFLSSLKENLFTPAKLKEKINQFNSEYLDHGSRDITYFFEIQFPLSSPPGMTSDFVETLLEGCNNALVGASGGGGELAPHIGNWMDEKEGTLVKEPMKTMKYDVQLSKLVDFAIALHRVILNIQQYLKQKVVYVKMDQEVRHIDALKQSDDYFPAHNEFDPPNQENVLPQESTIEGLEIIGNQLSIKKMNFVNSRVMGEFLAVVFGGVGNED